MEFCQNPSRLILNSSYNSRTWHFPFAQKQKQIQSVHHERDICPKYDDVIKWKHFPRYWPFVRGVHRSPASDMELCFRWSAPWINGWVDNREARDLRRHCAHYGIIVMKNSNVFLRDFIQRCPYPRMYSSLPCLWLNVPWCVLYDG